MFDIIIKNGDNIFKFGKSSVIDYSNGISYVYGLLRDDLIMALRPDYIKSHVKVDNIDCLLDTVEKVEDDVIAEIYNIKFKELLDNSNSSPINILRFNKDNISVNILYSD